MVSPAPMSVRGRYLPALDGIRALAIAGVIAYHLGAGWAKGGYLGVDLFFVLSGFLITSLLVEQRLDGGSLRLSSFWARRARRLLPGLLLMLVGLGIFLAAFGPGPLADTGEIRADAVATLLYVANWHQLLAHQSYFQQFSAPSPLAHTWSLGIEEQFYLLWPLVLAGVFAVASGRWRRLGLAVAALGAVASAGWMAWLASQGASLDRMYYGTDTRAADLLVGAVLAFATAGRPQPSRAARRVLAILAPAALVALGVLWARAGGSGGTPPRAMFAWGFALAAVLAAAVIADARQVAPSPLGRLLALPPLVFVGQISYELYLWHWPVIVELTPARTGLGGAPLLVVRLAAMSLAAAGSFYLVDRPLRRLPLARWRRRRTAFLVPASMALAAGVIVAGTLESPPVVSHVTAVDTSGPRTPGAGGIVGGPIRLAGTPTRAHPLRIVLFGDSVMRDEAGALGALLGSTGVVSVKDDGFDGWGFTTDRGWRQGVPAQIAADHAELVVAMWSFDDDYLVAHPVRYRRWLEEFVHLVLAEKGVAGLVFEQFPTLGPSPVSNPLQRATSEKANNGPIDAWNALARSMVRLDPRRVMYLPVGSAVEHDGRFSSWLPPGNRWALPPSRWVRVRAVDGVHFCAPGAARYAAAVAADLTVTFHLPPAAPGWTAGAWTRAAQFDTPPGNCPDDHPTHR